MVKLIVSEDDVLMIGPVVFIIFWIAQFMSISPLTLGLFTSVIYPVFAVVSMLTYMFKISDMDINMIREAFNSDETYIANIDVENAFSPGLSILPIIFINDEIFDSEDERNGVINHEIAHNKFNHILKQSTLSSMFIFIIVAIVVSINSVIASMVIGVLTLLVAGFVIGNVKYYQEIEADLYASNQENSNIKKYRKKMNEIKEDHNINIGSMNLKYKDIHPDSETFIKKIEDNR